MEDRLRGSAKTLFLQEFVTNTAHYPLANAVLVFVLVREFNYSGGLEAAAMCAGAVVQAYLLARWAYRRTPRDILGNLIGPAIFGAVTLSVSGVQGLLQSNHLGYLIFCLIIGLLHSGRRHVTGSLGETLIMIESVARASILLGMYWIFEVVIDIHYSTLSGFFSDYSHVYVSIVIPTLGLLLGVANVSRSRSWATVQEVATRLKTLSEWSWGPGLVRSATNDPDSLTLTRRQRAVVFMDIRGFTNWSETHISSEVTEMLQAFYEASESVWSRYPFVTAKFSADEVLVVFDATEVAVRAALELRDAARDVLEPFGLGAGAGVNAGQLAEGVIGSRNKKTYEVIGDVVNVASRLCKAAAVGQILVSDSVALRLEPMISLDAPVSLSVPGKQDLVRAYPVTGLAVPNSGKREEAVDDI